MQLVCSCIELFELLSLLGAALSTPVTRGEKKCAYDTIVALSLCCVLFVHL